MPPANQQDRTSLVRSTKSNKYRCCTAWTSGGCAAPYLSHALRSHRHTHAQWRSAGHKTHCLFCHVFATSFSRRMYGPKMYCKGDEASPSGWKLAMYLPHERISGKRCQHSYAFSLGNAVLSNSGRKNKENTLKMGTKNRSRSTRLRSKWLLICTFFRWIKSGFPTPPDIDNYSTKVRESQ